MRLALVLAPSDPRTGDAAPRREALAWLRGRLARYGFHVVIVGGAHDPQADIDRAIDRVREGDTVLVHVSGRLALRNALAFGETGRIELGVLSAALAERQPGHVSFVLELTHDEPTDDALLATEILGDAMRSLGARERGFPVLAAVRPTVTRVDRVAFTRLALRDANDSYGPPPTEAIVASMYHAASATEAIHTAAQSFTFARGVLPEPLQVVAPASAEALPEEASEEVFSIPPPPSLEPSIHSLIAEATEQRDWPRALELRRHRLHILASPRQKVRELVAIARILQAELRQPDAAIEALELARTMAPRPVSVLQALRRGYERLGRWERALEIIGALADLAPTPAERSLLRAAGGRLALGRLADPARAMAWLEAAVADDPANADAFAALEHLRPPQGPDAASYERAAERMFAAGNDDEGLIELDAAAALSPRRASIYEKAFVAHRRAGRTDDAFLAAQVLEELLAADVDQRMLVDQFRSVGAVRARLPLDASGWELLRAPGSDDILTALFAAVESAAIAARVDELREGRRLVTLNPAERLSDTSTASIVRTLRWAARLLSVPCPHLYVAGDIPGGMAAIPAREASTAVGSAVLSGRSAKDLAFLAGKHLTYYRPGCGVLLHYPGRDDLTTLLLAAAQFAMPEAGAPSNDSAVRALKTRLARHLGDEETVALKRAVRALDARGGQVALHAWMCSIELAAARAGLLLCGDLATATALVRAEVLGVANVPAETKRDDLIAFCASRAHASLRARFTVTAPVSALSPPSSSRLQARA